MAFSQISVTDTGVTFTHKGVEQTVLYVDIDAELITEANAEKARKYLQDQIDVVIKRNTLPSDDEHRISDPARAAAFWSTGNNITYRNTLVTVFIENGLFNVGLQTLDYYD